jgi:hypothetical protein
MPCCAVILKVLLSSLPSLNPLLYFRQVPVAFGLGGPAASSFINITLNQLMKKGKLNAKKIEI